MKVIVAGSRAVTDYDLVARAIKESGFAVTEVVSGTARGVDRLGEEWAQENGIPVRRFPADWEAFGRAAGYKRNALMAKYAEALVALHLDNSKGTLHMVSCMTDLGKPVYVVEMVSHGCPFRFERTKVWRANCDQASTKEERE